MGSCQSSSCSPGYQCRAWVRGDADPVPDPILDPIYRLVALRLDDEADGNVLAGHARSEQLPVAEVAADQQPALAAGGDLLEVLQTLEPDHVADLLGIEARKRQELHQRHAEIAIEGMRQRMDLGGRLLPSEDLFEDENSNNENTIADTIFEELAYQSLLIE